MALTSNKSVEEYILACRKRTSSIIFLLAVSARGIAYTTEDSGPRNASHQGQGTLRVTWCRPDWWGKPGRILSDQGREFCASVNDELCKAYGIKRSVTSAIDQSIRILDIDCNQRVALETVKNSKKLNRRVSYNQLRPYLHSQLHDTRSDDGLEHQLEKQLAGNL
ncbi:hypothetical protein Pmani_024197 [Petrolisthes manimaculis]|uniref:Uncharacterized protein n=1 Tax=Petrolisthes manimaculis TaxID=1843537 RepID=A0AAE1TZK5_9EUCA|nr:hypothetical protein Pmani_024197 [Petrolisthes manimaculis]